MKFKRYVVEYWFEGKLWSLDIMAADKVEAWHRLEAVMRNGKVQGPVAASVWVGPRWLWRLFGK